MKCRALCKCFGLLSNNTFTKNLKIYIYIYIFQSLNSSFLMGLMPYWGPFAPPPPPPTKKCTHKILIYYVESKLDLFCFFKDMALETKTKYVMCDDAYKYSSG